MKKLRFLVVLFLMLGLSIHKAWAAPPTWEIDAGHSNIYFSVKHIYSHTRGHFNTFSGDITFDPNNLKESSVNFTIEVKSINTNIAKRDKHLLSPDFFDAKAHPEIQFNSDSITSSGVNNFDVHGKLTIKGKSHDLVLPLTLEGVKDHPMKKGASVAGFNGTVTLDRLALGVGSGKFLAVVGQEVDVFVSLEVIK